MLLIVFFNFGDAIMTPKCLNAAGQHTFSYRAVTWIIYCNNCFHFIVKTQVLCHTPRKHHVDTFGQPKDVHLELLVDFPMHHLMLLSVSIQVRNLKLIVGWNLILNISWLPR